MTGEFAAQPIGVPEDVASIRKAIRSFLDTPAPDGSKIGNDSTLVLNEKDIAPAQVIQLPPSYRRKAIPDDLGLRGVPRL